MHIRYLAYMVYMSNLVGIFVFWHIFGKTWSISYSWMCFGIYEKLLGVLYMPLLHVECVAVWRPIFVQWHNIKYVYNTPCCRVDEFICGIYMCIESPYIHVKYLAYVPNLVGTCFWHIFGNNMWSRSCSWLCFSIYIQKFWAHISL